MKYMQVKVKCEVEFLLEVEDDEWEDREEDGWEEDYENIIETLSDRTNQYWRDADMEWNEIPESNIEHGRIKYNG